MIGADVVHRQEDCFVFLQLALHVHKDTSETRVERLTLDDSVVLDERHQSFGLLLSRHLVVENEERRFRTIPEFALRMWRQKTRLTRFSRLEF